MHTLDRPSPTTSAHTVVVGLGFGDEAKGATVDYLASRTRYSSVVRFNGGAQAAHNVIVAGVHHTFRQFGSATFSETPTYLSRHSRIDPWRLASEAEILARQGISNPLRLVTVSPHALIVTPVHVAANRTREELRGAARHGSCGLGIGETTWYDLAAHQWLAQGQSLYGITAAAPITATALTVADCLDSKVLEAKLVALAQFYAPLLNMGSHAHPAVAEMVTDLIEFGRTIPAVPDRAYLSDSAATGPLLFEGAQGVLLDEWRGFHPHTTWSTTLPAAAQQLLAEAGEPRGRVLGVTRTYTTRHGAGPMPTEDPGLSQTLPELHNGEGIYQGGWRTGHLDTVMLRHSAELCRRHGGLDALAVTHLDSVAAAGDELCIARHYQEGEDYLSLGVYQDLSYQETLTAKAFVAVPVLEPLDPPRILDELSSATGVPVALTSDGPARSHRAESTRPYSVSCLT
ncbi:adenylosuccinate synthetase [Mycobacteroides abscessus subsp. abscessus]|uniref:adenylosuccinate synthetase n=1 Tax=Mycobacteroides abscessus TaxID=36809 RepID=UPI0009297A57|nr:adenylosuccinate synthetase [Mycobacteroides abscessus]SIH33926.1 adenylosuccinate synthetase [Mycobacteroides abscessus subsp. abscessus]